ncbi:MAG: dTDP-4-dehydrorhamnose reductase [Pusillimonas sp.]|jgi:dTDP-4-dehydrorhamnose reductase|nr:dTDP-4-dehydrorhamnose reductase [Pusillimonas sp.]
MKVLLLGSSGQLGFELTSILTNLGEVIAPQRFDTALPGNLLDLSTLQDTVQRIKPNLIVNAAAFTAVDLAEKNPSLARQVNTRAPKMLANEALTMNAWLVHFSTDYVFNGQGTRPWTETDPGDPLNVYGRTKLEGDQAILASGCKHLILRTSWVYGLHGHNFAKTILEKAQTQDSLKVVNDQFGAPTSAELLASLTTQALLPAMKNPKLGGLYHVAAQGEASWYTYAQFLLEQALHEGLTLRVKPEDLIPVSSAQWSAPAARPSNSRLNTTRFCETFGLTLPHWQEGVTQFVRAYAKLHKR